jgi:hypothetical protein
MLSKHNVLFYIQNVFTKHFIKETESTPIALNEVEIRFLEQLLWFTANVVADSDKSRVAALENNVDKYLGVVIHNYHTQFTP